MAMGRGLPELIEEVERTTDRGKGTHHDQNMKGNKGMG